LLRSLSTEFGALSACTLPDGRAVLTSPAAARATGARVISDFRVMGDQRDLCGPVASVPTAWRALKEAASSGDRARRKVTAAAVNRARRHAWAQAGSLPPVKAADRKLEGVTCIRLDGTVVPAHSDKELAEANLKGYGHHPLLADCDNTGEPLAWMLRPGSARVRHRGRSPAAAPRGRRGPAAGAAAQDQGDLRRGRAPATSWSGNWTGSRPGTATRSPGPSAGRSEPASRPRSSRSPNRRGNPPSTGEDRSRARVQGAAARAPGPHRHREGARSWARPPASTARWWAPSC
jgi:hypothetical protein